MRGSCADGAPYEPVAWQFSLCVYEFALSSLLGIDQECACAEANAYFGVGETPVLGHIRVCRRNTAVSAAGYGGPALDRARGGVAESSGGRGKGEPVAPRPGGETDKFGNRYEGVWTIRHALYVLLGQGDSLTLEPNGILGEGTEFAYRHGGRTEVHQVKRQNRNANSWNVASLEAKGIWPHLRTHAEAGHEFHFVSMVPARPLQELGDRARRSDDFPPSLVTG